MGYKRVVTISEALRKATAWGFIQIGLVMEAKDPDLRLDPAFSCTLHSNSKYAHVVGSTRKPGIGLAL
jgi:hypothetical protein